MTPNEIAEMVVTSDRVSDQTGLTNFERFNFVCHMFKVGSISMSDTFDFDALIQSEDLHLILAGYHLATLQLEWVERCNSEGMCEGEWYETATAFLLNAKRKMLWAESFIKLGDTPPPYPFVN